MPLWNNNRKTNFKVVNPDNKRIVVVGDKMNVGLMEWTTLYLTTFD